jgi:hypothetical protein
MVRVILPKVVSKSGDELLAIVSESQDSAGDVGGEGFVPLTAAFSIAIIHPLTGQPATADELSGPFEILIEVDNSLLSPDLVIAFKDANLNLVRQFIQRSEMVIQPLSDINSTIGITVPTPSVTFVLGRMKGMPSPSPSTLVSVGSSTGGGGDDDSGSGGSGGTGTAGGGTGATGSGSGDGSGSSGSGPGTGSGPQLKLVSAPNPSSGPYYYHTDSEYSTSANGNLVAIATRQNASGSDTNAHQDIYVLDRSNNSTQWISRGAGGVNSDGSSSRPRISPDGRYVLFQSDAANLVSGDTNGALDVFLYDRQQSIMVRVSLAQDGSELNGASSNAEMSADGRYIVFQTSATNHGASDGNSATDILLRDVSNNSTVLVSDATDAGAQAANAKSEYPHISSNGAIIAFQSTATNLVAGDTNTRQDIFAMNVGSGQLSLISRATDPDTENLGTLGNNISERPIVSGNGLFVFFASTATNLVTGDTNGMKDIFRRTLSSGLTIRASSAGSDVQAAAGNVGTSFAVSDDGNILVFESAATNLVASDTNAKQDIFLRNISEDTTTRASVTDDEAEAQNTSSVPTYSSAGIFFYSSATNLVSGDDDQVGNIFLRDMVGSTTAKIAVAS